jgi:hypothetical protein
MEFKMKNKLQKLPVGIQSFEDIRENNYLYVDKTEYIFNMIENGKYYFLSRPRRFGKSLIVNTMESLFKGNEKYFKGLYIHNKWDWNETYPVILIDFGKISNKTSEKLEASIDRFINKTAKQFSVHIEDGDIVEKFADLIEEIHNTINKKVVVLIDEYNKPIIDNIHNLKIADDNRRILHDFYQVLKSNDEYLKFAFLIGVSKFSGTSIFSGLNNPKDISLYDDFATICGYTHTELEDYFKDYIEELAIKQSQTYGEALDEINSWYDGYSWNGVNKVYNPFSTLLLLDSKDFSNYWFKTGTPTFLVETLKKNNDLKPILEPFNVFEKSLNSFDIHNLHSTSLLFQTGYLTIKEINKVNRKSQYLLDFPNFEVKDSLMNYLLEIYTNYQNDLDELKLEVLDNIKNLDSEVLQLSIEKLLAHIPYDLIIEKEKYYHSLFLVWFLMLGFKIDGEVLTHIGKIDAILYEKEYDVIIEFKYTKTKKSIPKFINEALKQIDERKYYLKSTNKKIIKVAIVFSKKEVICEIEEKLSFS